MKRMTFGIFFFFSGLACSGQYPGQAERTSSDSRTLSGKGPSVAETSFLNLQAFPTCPIADEYLRTNLRRILKDDFNQSREYFIQAGNRGRYWEEGAAEDSAAPESSKGSDNGGSKGPEDFTKTNTQVAGIDEPDMMKTDGKYIYSISGENVHVVQSWPANEMKKLGSIAVKGSPINLFLTENSQLIIASHPKMNVSQQDESGTIPPWYRYAYYDNNITRLEVYDVSNPAAPALKKTFHFSGNYLDMRREKSVLRLISSTSWNMFPEGIVQWIEYYNEKGDKISLEDWDKQRAIAESQNESIIQSLTFSKWMTDISRRNFGSRSWEGITNDLLDKPDLDCSAIYASEALGQFGLTKVTSLDIDTDKVGQTAILAPATMIYSSHDSLYVAYSYQNWWWGWNENPGSKTYLHKFSYDKNDAAKVLYQGSGMLGGFLLNQFSLDEHKDHLRVAITDDRHVEEQEQEQEQNPNNGRTRFTTINRIVTMKSDGQKLSVVGQTKDLAPGERIYSARFKGDKGYVVTFRQVDPLYTLDLSNPADPKVLGELKVNGFSSYIHMIDDNHLLTVGQDADPETGRVTGLKISVFDVTDPSAPTEKHKLLVNDISYGSSEAEYNHHAFTYFASRGLLGLPVGGYKKTNSSTWWNSYQSELRVFKIDLAAGISQKGSIVMNDLYQGQNYGWDYWWGGASVRRSVFADDYIYAISDTGIRAVNGEDMMKPVGSVSFYP